MQRGSHDATDLLRSDARNWRYKPFDQINASNFSSLQVAWRFRTDNLGPSLDFRLGATPVMANGVV